MQLSKDAIARIKEAMESKGINQQDLSDRTNIHPSNMSCYLSGKKNISKRTVDRIAAELTVDPRWILYGDEEFINHQKMVREYMYGKLEEALNERTLSDDQLVLMKSILSMPERQVEGILKLFKSINKENSEMNSVDLAYKMAAEQDSSKKKQQE